MDGDFIRDSIEARDRSDLKSGAASALRSIYTALTLVSRPVVLLPAAAYLALQVAFTYLYLHGVTGPWKGLWAIFAGPGAAGRIGHYPEHLILLKPVLGRFTMLLDTFVDILLQAVTVSLVASAFRKRRTSLKEGFTLALGRYGRLLVISVAGSAAVFLLINGSGLISSGLTGIPRLAVSGLGVLAALAVQAMLVFAIPMIVLTGTVARDVLPASLSLAWKYLATAIFLVLVPFILTVPTTFLSLKAEIIALRLSPELMIYSHVASLVMESAAGWLITAGATVFLVHRTGWKR